MMRRCLLHVVCAALVLMTWAAPASAAIAIDSKCWGFTAGSATTFSCNLSNVGAGNTIAVTIGGGGANTISSVTDTQGDTFTLGTQVQDGSGVGFAGTAYVLSAAGCTGTNCNTVTVTFSASTSHRSLVAYELTGVVSVAGNNARAQTNPGNVADAVTSNTFTTSQAGAFIIGVTQAQGAIGNVNIGTTVTGGGTYTAAGGATAVDACGSPRVCHEYTTQTSASSSSRMSFTNVNTNEDNATAALSFESTAGTVKASTLMLIGVQ